MKEIFNSNGFEVESSELRACSSNGLLYDSPRYIREELYRTSDGTFFLRGEGGCNSKYSNSDGKNNWGIVVVVKFSGYEAYEWLKVLNKNKEIQKYISNYIKRTEYSR